MATAVLTNKAECIAEIMGAIVDYYVNLAQSPADSVPDLMPGRPIVGWEPFGQPELAYYSNWPDELQGMEYERGWRHRARFSDGNLIHDKLELHKPGEDGTYYVYVIDDKVVFIARPWMEPHMGPSLPLGE